MPNFFVPAAKNEEQAKRVYGSIRKHIENHFGELEERKIFSLLFKHEGKRQLAEIGAPLQGEPVLAIFKKDNYGIYYVCTENRGAVKGHPILVGEHDVLSEEDFEA